MHDKQRRLDILNRSKRYRYLLLLILLVWALIGFFIIKVDPDNIKDVILPGSFLLFGLLLFLGIFLLLSLLLLSSKRAFVWALGIVTFLYLRLWGLGNLFTGIFLFGFLCCLDLYRWQKNRSSSLNP